MATLREYEIPVAIDQMTGTKPLIDALHGVRSIHMLGETRGQAERRVAALLNAFDKQKLYVNKGGVKR